MASASWKLCSMSGLQTPSASELETSLAPRPPPDEGPSLELESSEPASERGACGGGAPPPPPVRPGPEFQGDEILNTEMGATLQVYRETVEVAESTVQISTRQPQSSGHGRPKQLPIRPLSQRCQLYGKPAVLLTFTG